MQDHGVWLSLGLTFGKSDDASEGLKLGPRRKLNQSQTEILRYPSPAGPGAIMIMISYFRKAFANKHAISRAQKMKPLRRFPTLHEQSSQVKLFARTFRSITTCKHPSAIVSVSRVSVPVPLLDVSTCSIMVFISHFMLSQSNSITTLQCFYGNGNGTELS